MIRMKLSAPQAYGLWDGDRLLAECRFSLEDTALLIDGIDRHGPTDAIEGFDPVDALLRATTNHALPLGIDRVICRDPALFDPLMALRFTRHEDRIESTPDEVLRHLCGDR